MSSRRPTQRDRNQQTTEYSLNRPNTFTKLDLKPRRYHFYNVVLFIFGTLFPPLAVAARFGLGSDFWLNLLLTICGYIPGHGHNFYIQNIRNNKNHKRTPKWAIRYGLVDDSEIRRKERRSQWAGRYNDRLPNSTLEGRQVEEGQVPDGPSRDPSATDVNANARTEQEGRLWDSTQDEQFYGQKNKGARESGSVSTATGGGRWHYPANFDEAELDSPNGMELDPSASSGKKKGFLGGGKKKKDRWALSEDARKGTRVPDGEYVGESDRKKKKKEGKAKRRKRGESDTDSYVGGRQRSGSASRSEIEEPEDAVGGLYGNTSSRAPQKDPAEQRQEADREIFEHQF
ncbi:hypothetical protein M408DRAFT_333963 [Serendipita vermifera MAFF 305830]|uniref:Uncharacterized protein n=1 Tax=Serendipita vermifera MAFF 305830 TaxID=933852 RepID=A0A0C3AKB4_SERVB|nr:hypothetical protein M408DRAFT_333963 [Serendipita vermifera MAFF 305830]